MRDRREEFISHLSYHETTLLSFFSVQGSSQTAVGVLPQRVSRQPPARPLYESRRRGRGAEEAAGGFI